jgi:hypothetical protein
VFCDKLKELLPSLKEQRIEEHNIVFCMIIVEDIMWWLYLVFAVCDGSMKLFFVSQKIDEPKAKLQRTHGYVVSYKAQHRDR